MLGEIKYIQEKSASKPLKDTGKDSNFFANKLSNEDSNLPEFLKKVKYNKSSMSVSNSPKKLN